MKEGFSGQEAGGICHEQGAMFEALLDMRDELLGNIYSSPVEQ